VQNSGTHARLTAAVVLARSEDGINVSQEEFDTHPMLLNVRNGVLDLGSGELRPHDPTLRQTQLASVAYDPDARSELWERFVMDVTSGDDEKAAFLQESFGVALTGDVSDELLWCHNGGGCNGKSTALEAVGRMLGDYAAVAPPGMFAARKFDAHPTELAGLRGKRFVTAVEQEANRALRESLIKQMTGGDKIRTRGMREDFWEMLPTWHIHIAYNVAPRLTGTDDGIRRRLVVVPWDASFKGAPDPTIKERLLGEAERPGILNWCLDGLRRRLLTGRVQVPEVCRLKTDEYLDDEDVIGRFLLERTTADDAAVLELREMLKAFREWMEADGVQRYVIDQFTCNSLGRELARRGYRKMRPDSGQHRKQTVVAGLRLVGTADDGHAWQDEGWQTFSR
jgi:putative DNA primase/helicase